MPIRKAAVSVYFCGSGNNETHGDQYTVPHLFNATAGKRKIIFDGPGGSRIKNTEAVLKSLEGGKNASKSWKFWRSSDKRLKQGWDNMLEAAHWKNPHSVTGIGTQSNIVMAMQWLWLEWYATGFSDVNIVGFSRGGVSAIMLAHAIQESGMTQQGQFRVNIFTFDPVPGSTNDFKAGLFNRMFRKDVFASTGRTGDPKKLAPCVTAYRSILQENLSTFTRVTSKDIPTPLPKDMTFKCVAPQYTGSNKRRTPREFYQLPGGHGDGARWSNKLGTGAIGMHLAQSFLMENGTRFLRDETLTDTQLLEAYALTRLSFSATPGRFGAKRKASFFRKDLVENPFRDHPFYVNSHHATLLHMNLPNVARLIESETPLPEGRAAMVARTNPQTFANLSNAGYLN
ncbi:MAG: hypothetical protein AAFU80_15325 [Pseudomonadota bacterium]